MKTTPPARKAVGTERRERDGVAGERGGEGGRERAREREVLVSARDTERERDGQTD